MADRACARTSASRDRLADTLHKQAKPCTRAGICKACKCQNSSQLHRVFAKHHTRTTSHDLSHFSLVTNLVTNLKKLQITFRLQTSETCPRKTATKSSGTRMSLCRMTLSRPAVDNRCGLQLKAQTLRWCPVICLTIWAASTSQISTCKYLQTWIELLCCEPVKPVVR